MKKQTYICDMKGVRNQADVMFRIRKKLNAFYNRTESGEANLVDRDFQGGYSAFADDIRGLLIKKSDPTVTDVELIISNFLEIAKNVSQKVNDDILDVLAWQTDPKQRIDGLSFTFQVRLNDYDSEGEAKHIQIHRGTTR